MTARSLRHARRRLRLWLFVFFVALALPSAVLVYRALDQLQWEAFHSEQIEARALMEEIDRRLQERVASLDARPFEDFTFAVREPDGSLRRSPLSDPGLPQALPGVIGYFQVDPRGRFSSPLLPDDPDDRSGVDALDTTWDQRVASAQRVREVLVGNRLVAGAPTPPDGRLAARIPAALHSARRDAPPTVQDEIRFDAAGASSSDPRRLSRDGRAKAEIPWAEDIVSMDPGEMAEEAEPMRAQAGFDELSSSSTKSVTKSTAGSLGKLSELNLSPQRTFGNRSTPSALGDRDPASPSESDMRQRQERAPTMPSPSPSPSPSPTTDRSGPATSIETLPRAIATEAASKPEARVRMFEQVADAFELRLIDSGHFVLFRKIWYQGERFIQGALIDRAAFVAEAVLTPYRRSGLASSTGLVVAFGGDVLALESAADGGRYLSAPSELRGELLDRARLSSPLGGLELLLSVTELPAAPGAPVVIWTALVLALVLAGGLVLMERLGSRQLALVAQQQDFVAAVSHELKTPLTSIRMYSEMLCTGWGDDERRMTYYHYIHDESERLSRLIANVLQLARMNRDELRVDPKPVSVGALLELLESRAATSLDRAGFGLDIDVGDPRLAERPVSVDPDAMLQILLNLVDNALKFAAQAEPQEIQVRCREDGPKRICLALRDFGPGVAQPELRRIFRPFYRSRTAIEGAVKGTGIGLALVARLVQAMGGDVTAHNRDPGLEVRISLPVADVVTGAPRDASHGREDP